MTISIRQERLYELLADKALVGLSPHEQSELAELLRDFPGADDGTFERAAAAAALAAMAGKIEPLPVHLAERIANDAESSMPAFARAPLAEEHTVAMVSRPLRPPPQAPPMPQPMQPAWIPPHPMQQGMQQAMQPRGQVVPFPPPPAQPAKKPARWPLVVSWLAAAACLTLAAGVYWKYRPRETVAVAPSQLREELAQKPGTQTIPWTPTDDPASKTASGDVVWNAAIQQGYMRFRGLAKNDPNVSQYQLWIFDKTRDEKYPVDGGVFDIDTETGDVIVPIRAKIKVDEATLFAVTVERPGGVVVSKRERIVVTAKVGG